MTKGFSPLEEACPAVAAGAQSKAVLAWAPDTSWARHLGRPKDDTSFQLSQALNLEMPCTKDGKMPTKLAAEMPVRTCPSALPTDSSTTAAAAPSPPASALPARSYSRLVRHGADVASQRQGEGDADFCLRLFAFLSCVVDCVPYGIDMDIEPEGPTIVSLVTANSYAEQAGVCVGDLLLEVNGQPVETGAEVWAALSAPRPYTLTFARGPPGGWKLQACQEVRDAQDGAAQPRGLRAEPTEGPPAQRSRRGKADRARRRRR